MTAIATFAVESTAGPTTVTLSYERAGDGEPTSSSTPRPTDTDSLTGAATPQHAGRTCPVVTGLFLAATVAAFLL
jgi:hypothetical protein